jgi:hypothetical protein
VSGGVSVGGALGGVVGAARRWSTATGQSHHSQDHGRSKLVFFAFCFKLWFYCLCRFFDIFYPEFYTAKI